MTTPDERRRQAEARRDELLAAVQADRENAARRLDMETAAREMFPAEYAAITDDQPMDPAKVQAVKAELARRQAADLLATSPVDPEVACLCCVNNECECEGGQLSQPEPKTVSEPDPIRPRWVCKVDHPGYTCLSTEPHQSWGCGWRYEISRPATPETEAWLRGHGFNPQPAT